jgi:hypothetical protein
MRQPPGRPWAGGFGGITASPASTPCQHPPTQGELDGQDVYPWRLKWKVAVLGRLGKLARAVDLADQVEASRRVFASDTRWTVVRGSELEEGPSQGLPVWSRHVGDPILASNITRRVDFALFMVAALDNDELVHEAPAIVGCRTLSALAHG